MGRKWNPDGVPNDLLIPKGTFHFEVGEIEEVELGGFLAYKPDLTIVEPKAYKGKKLFGITYFIGSSDDKEARDPETWAASRGAVDLKKLIVAAGVKPSGDMDKDREATAGRVVGITVGKKPRRNDETRIDNTAQDYWKQGTRALEVFDDDGVPAKAAPRPAVAPKPIPAAVAGGVDLLEGLLMVSPPAPVRSTEPTPKPGKPKAGDMKACPKCDQQFKRNDLMAHMADCTVGDDEDEDD